MGKKAEEDSKAKVPGWMVSFGDMMTLILVFFILLYTLANFEDEAYREMVESVQVIDGECTHLLEAAGRGLAVGDIVDARGRRRLVGVGAQSALGCGSRGYIIGDDMDNAIGIDTVAVGRLSRLCLTFGDAGHQCQTKHKAAKRHTAEPKTCVRGEHWV